MDLNDADLCSCPCCGGDARFGEIEDEDSEDYAAQFAACTKCGLTTRLWFACGEDPKPLIAEAWNRRAEVRPDVDPPPGWEESQQRA